MSCARRPGYESVDRPGENSMIKRLLCTAIVLNASAAHAQDVAAFYRGKQLRFVVGSAVGGAYDLYARALARQIVHYIPGNPTIIVQNQPAAGGPVMTQQIKHPGAQRGPPKGLAPN